MFKYDINMKNLSLILGLLLMTNLFGQHKITTMSEYNEWAARKKTNDLLKVNFDGKSYIDSVLILLNKYRIENGSDPVILSDNLCKVAELQSQYCANNLILTHKQDNEELSELYLRGLKFNERGAMGEIISQCSIDMLSISAKNKTIPSSVIENFKTSSGHSYIMRDETYTRCGISLVQSKKDPNLYYVAIVFSVN